MACAAVTTGNGFLVSVLSHLDCQAQLLGSYGFQSLAQPGSPAALALAAMLTIFIALIGIRLLLGAGDGPRDWVGAVLKIGIVLTLAGSWPAFRTVIYDAVLFGPAEIAGTIAPSTLPDSGSGFAARLQAVDTGMAALALAGTGRQTGEIVDEGVTSSFRSIALEDETGFGWARSVYLAATIGSLATLRISAGLLLAIAPLVAGLLLFDLTRGIFAGWLRGLVMTALGSCGITVLLAVELALLEPWLRDVLERRGLGYATPSAPTEMLALVLAFAAAIAGIMFLLTKIAFQNAWSSGARMQELLPRTLRNSVGPENPVTLRSTVPVHGRAAAVSESVTATVRRERGEGSEGRRVFRTEYRGMGTERQADGPAAGSHAPALGSTYRRTGRTTTASHRRRDRGQ